jgi:hypothetical protein
VGLWGKDRKRLFILITKKNKGRTKKKKKKKKLPEELQNQETSTIAKSNFRNVTLMT